MRRFLQSLAVVTACVLLIGCSSGGSGSGTGTGGTGSARSVKLQGSGASFPDPLYQRWFKTYSEATPGVTVDYTATGSGAGITDLTNQLVDFAGSDAAMSDDEIAKVDAGVQLLPVTAGKVVLAYKLSDGPASLKLSREAYTKIFLGEITKWNDPLIAAANEGVTMPDRDITVVARADSSGTTYVFTQHLSAVSQAWADGPGTGKSVEWPAKNLVKAPKNAGVTKQIKDMDGVIGYIEYGYAKLNNLKMAWLENKAGKYVEPTLETGTAALANVPDMPENLRVWLPDPEGDESYPIVTYTWLMAYKKYDDPAKAEALRNLVKWCVTQGQAMSGEMGYIPLPSNVAELVTKAVENVQ
jgi:phosphate transport system substrate-binding protein